MYVDEGRRSRDSIYTSTKTWGDRIQMNEWELKRHNAIIRSINKDLVIDGVYNLMPKGAKRVKKARTRRNKNKLVS